MPRKPTISVGDMFSTKACGVCTVIEYLSSDKVRVQFALRDDIVTVSAGNLRKGLVRNPYTPNVSGVGYFGVGKHKASVNRKMVYTYAVWASMLSRCYDTKAQKKSPTYIGCTVCDEWHNYQTFADWMVLQDYQGKELDKDSILLGNKIYSPETCTFISQKANVQLSSSKTYTFINPIGEVTVIHNLAEYCRNNKLNANKMRYVQVAENYSYKGWTRPPIL